MGKVVYHWDDLRHTAFDTSPLRLTAIAGTDSFHYLICDSQDVPCAARGYLSERKYHFFDNPLGYINRLIGEDDLLYADFENVTFAVRAVPFIVTTPEQSDADSIRTSLLKTTDLSPSDEIFYDQIDDDLAIGFALAEVFAQEARAWFSNASICHVISGLISRCIEISANRETHVLLLNITRNLVEAVLCLKGGLVFANHFRISGPEDVLYYSSAILRDQGVLPENCALACSGYVAMTAMPQLQAYFPKTELTTSLVASPDVDFPAVHTIDLICVSKCAS